METGRPLRITHQPAWPNLQVPGQREALSKRMKWTAPEKWQPRVSSGLCTYPHMGVYTEKTGLHVSGVNAVGFLKGWSKRAKKSWNVHGGGNATVVMGREALLRGRQPLQGLGAPGRSAACVFPSASVSMTDAFLLRPFLSFTSAPSQDTHSPLVLPPSKWHKTRFTLSTLWRFVCLSYQGCKNHNL